MATADRNLGEWSGHYQQPFRDDAANPKFGMPLRVAFLAFGNHRANGHANFQRQEIAQVLGKFDDQGTFQPADRRTVNRAIQQAIEFGLLAEGSLALCLIVPQHRVFGGPGKEDAPCKRKHSVSRSTRSLRAVA